MYRLLELKIPQGDEDNMNQTTHIQKGKQSLPQDWRLEPPLTSNYLIEWKDIGENGGKVNFVNVQDPQLGEMTTTSISL